MLSLGTLCREVTRTMHVLDPPGCSRRSTLTGKGALGIQQRLTSVLASSPTGISRLPKYHSGMVILTV